MIVVREELREPQDLCKCLKLLYSHTITHLSCALFALGYCHFEPRRFGVSVGSGPNSLFFRGSRQLSSSGWLLYCAFSVLQICSRFH